MRRPNLYGVLRENLIGENNNNSRAPLFVPYLSSTQHVLHYIYQKNPLGTETTVTSRRQRGVRLLINSHQPVCVCVIVSPPAESIPAIPSFLALCDSYRGEIQRERECVQRDGCQNSFYLIITYFPRRYCSGNEYFPGGRGCCTRWLRRNFHRELMKIIISPPRPDASIVNTFIIWSRFLSRYKFNARDIRILD